jgi:hypothetical protein
MKKIAIVVCGEAMRLQASWWGGNVGNGLLCVCVCVLVCLLNVWMWMWATWRYIYRTWVELCK